VSAGFLLPGAGEVVVAAPAPGAGPGWWAGASCAVLDEDDGTFVVAYRVAGRHGSAVTRSTSRVPRTV